MSTFSSSLVIPVFLPHQGCPHQCLFCNQNSITGQGTARISNEEIENTVNSWLAAARPRDRVQLAFYGGSFTCLPIDRQEHLFNMVRPYLKSGEIQSIRLSTRPDCLDAEICTFLRDMGVATVELGVQSLDDAVLERSRRGHSGKDCERAVAYLKEAAIEVGIQLMPGLPGEGTVSFLRGVRRVIGLSPSSVRLYPVLVVTNSALAEIYRLGQYRPLSLNKAVAMTRRAKGMFLSAGIRVIRIGLQPSPSLERELVAGPYHPAFGELVAARDWLRRTRALFAEIPAGSTLTVCISPRDLSAFIGPKRANMERLAGLGLAERLVIRTDNDMKRGSLNYVVG